MNMMKKYVCGALAAALVCGAGIFASCTQEKTLADRLIGKWMVAELDGVPAPTHLKAVITFESATKAYGSMADYSGESWNDRTPADVQISGNKVSMTVRDAGVITHNLDLTVSTITDKDMRLLSDWSMLVNGEPVYHEAYKEYWVRIDKDFRKDVVGIWEGGRTSGHSIYGDNEIHRWQFNADGTFEYYSKVGDSWVPTGDILCEYFVDGVLLCCRWQANLGSEEIRDWWEIDIRDGKMYWTALRVDEDGSTFTSSFEMTKLELK